MTTLRFIQTESGQQKPLHKKGGFCFSTMIGSRIAAFMIQCQHMKYPGTLVLIAGAAGSGKSALIRRAKADHPEIVYPHTATTRAMRPGEVNGEHYRFLTKEEFEHRVEAGEFLEWVSTDGKLYGTPKDEVIATLESGGVALKEMEPRGIRQVHEQFSKENVVTIYIDAGGWDTLSRRIQSRAPISPEELESRRKRFEYEQKFKGEADHVISNLDGHFEEADAAFDAIIQTLLPSAENSSS